MASTVAYPTPFLDRLGTNYAATEKEIPEIQRLVRQAKSIKSQLTTQMEGLKARLDACSSFISQHLCFLSPFRRIPSDILINIFLLCIPPMWSEKLGTPLEAPLLLTQVCREWRNLVQATPSCWSRLNISVPQYPSPFWNQTSLGGLVGDEENLRDVEDASDAEAVSQMAVRSYHRRMERKAQLASLWLLRGRECPMSLSITAPSALPGTADDQAKALDALILLFSEHASRWRHLRISAINPFPATLLSLSPSQVPQLQTVSLKWVPDFTVLHTGNQRPHSVSGSILNAPHIKRLAVDGFGGSLHRAGVRWEGITKLCIMGSPLVQDSEAPGLDSGFVSTPAALFLLQQCPNLIDFCVNISKDDHTGSTAHSVVRASRLTSLTIYENTSSPVFLFFDSLDLPALRSLAFSSMSDYYGPTACDERPSVLPFLRKVGSQLECLAFGLLDIAISDISPCLQATPNLNELLLDLSGGFRTPELELLPSDHGSLRKPPPYYLRNELLAALTPLDGGAYICPRLATIKIQVRVEFELASKAVWRLAAARRSETILERGIAKLEHLMIRFLDTSNRWHLQGNSHPPPRWSQTHLNESFGHNVIEVLWPKPGRTPRGSRLLEGWWESAPDDFIAR